MHLWALKPLSRAVTSSPPSCKQRTELCTVYAEARASQRFSMQLNPLELLSAHNAASRPAAVHSSESEKIKQPNWAKSAGKTARRYTTTTTLYLSVSRWLKPRFRACALQHGSLSTFAKSILPGRTPPPPPPLLSSFPACLLLLLLLLFWKSGVSRNIDSLSPCRFISLGYIRRFPSFLLPSARGSRASVVSDCRCSASPGSHRHTQRGYRLNAERALPREF